MASESEGVLSPGHGTVPGGRGAAVAETAVILLVFAASGAWPTPDVNETVYLTRALHFVEPTYGAGDWFLSTPDAHTIFYRLMGPILAACGLETGAWIGRWLGWLALAGGFRHAVAPLVPTAWGRLLAAGLFAIALRHTTAAGEWVIGGCEAKVFAWALVLPAIGEWARGRLASAVFLLGGATALHPIVGGWGLVAVGLTWLRECISAEGESIHLGRRAGGMSSLADTLAILTPTRPPPRRERTGLAFVGRSMDPALRGGLVVGGLALAACGVVPLQGLSAGVDAAGRAAANRIYVVERLPHHLLPGTFPEALIARHLLAILLGVIMHRIVPATPARTRVAAFRETALSISLVGCLIAAAVPLAPDLAIGLLRFYWFRLADVVVPFTLAASAASLLVDDAACRRALPGRPTMVRGLVCTALLLDLCVQSWHWPLPGRAAIASRADTKVNAAAWVDACGWVRDHVPAGSRFLTPRGAASFTWRTGLPEVVAWKNSPQDAASLLEWRRRITDCFSRDGTVADMERSTAALGADRMREVADRYAADHAIVPLDVAGVDALPFERLYSNSAYGVFRLDPSPDSR